MNSIINVITNNLSLLIIIVVIMVVTVGISLYMLKSPRKLKWSEITTFFVISVLLFGLTFTPSGAAKVKKSPRGKPSTVETGTKPADDTKKTDKSDNNKKNQTQNSR